MHKKLKTGIVISVMLIGLGIIWQTGFIEFISNTAKLQAFINEQGVLGYILYILLYIVVALFSLPASVITIIAGLVFGSVVGAIIALIGATIGATAAFLVARYIARDFIVSKFGDNKIFKKIEEGVEKNGKDFLILTRLVPLFPYNLQNYAYGITNMRLLPYVVISFFTMMPGSFIYAYLAGDIATNGISTLLFIKLLIAGILLFCVAQIPKFFAKRKGIEISKN